MNTESVTGITRREFLWTASIGLTGAVLGCAVNPVTGKKQFMLISEGREIDLDRRNSPHQFSADYGTVTDAALNRYVQETGNKLGRVSHRPDMPYSFQAVNAVYVNAYAFPGGSIAATRGVLLSMDNEAELAGLLGHEIGHVSARHTAARMSKGVLSSLVIAGAAAYAQTADSDLAPLAAGLGGIGAGLLLAKYSRDDERQADALGMEYMVRAGHNPRGMVGLMDVLRGLSKERPGAVEMMFASHPMSEERYETASVRMKDRYAAAGDLPLNRERYMDHTAGLRRIKGAIEKMQNGEKAMARREFKEADQQFSAALREAPDDYAGLLMMAKCRLAQNDFKGAKHYAEKAKLIYPGEAQALHLSGLANLREKDFDSAYSEFDRYEKLLPGNPNTFFLKGLSLEGMQHYKEAAVQYSRYLEADSQSDQAEYAYGRLVGWGYIKTK